MGSKQVVVVATRLKLRGWCEVRRFFRLNGAIRRQLNETPGAIGHWVRADFLRLRFYTISVWEDDEAINEFVRTGDHRTALVEFDEIAVRSQSGFVRWRMAAPIEVAFVCGVTIRVGERPT